MTDCMVCVSFRDSLCLSSRNFAVTTTAESYQHDIIQKLTIVKFDQILHAGN